MLSNILLDARHYWLYVADWSILFHVFKYGWDLLLDVENFLNSDVFRLAFKHLGEFQSNL